jgi:hypothetical protein
MGRMITKQFDLSIVNYQKKTVCTRVNSPLLLSVLLRFNLRLASARLRIVFRLFPSCAISHTKTVSPK